MFPIAGGKVGTPYGRKCCRKEGKKTTKHYWTNHIHKGVDISCPIGTNILAVADGKVVRVGAGNAFGSKTPVVEHIINGVPVYAFYAHASKSLVKVGDKVTKGQHIAESGEEGNAFGPHLHFEVQKKQLWSADGHVDPKPLLEA